MKKKVVSGVILTLLLIGMLTLVANIRQSSGLPPIEWTRTYGGTGYDDACSVVQTGDGGYAIAGGTDSFGAGGYDGWLVKTDSAGTVQWNQTYGGAGDDWVGSVVQTGDGGYAMAGGTDSFGAGGGDFWLVKTDSAGTVQWNQTYGGTGDDWVGSVVQTGDGGYAIAGYTYSFGAGGGDGWLVKTDSAGNMQWNQTYGGTDHDSADSVVQTSDGGYAMAGDTYSYGIGAPPYCNFWLVKTDSAGNVQWNQTYDGGTYHDYASSVVQTSDGGYAIAGGTDFFGAGSADFWLVKTDSAGTVQWNQTYGGADRDVAYSITETNDGGYALTGVTKSYGAGGYDFWLVKTDSAGNAVWNQTYGGTGWDVAFSVVQTGDGGYAIAGDTESFGAGDCDCWLVKLGPEPPYDVTIDAYCYTEDAYVSVSITMDGSPTGYTTPHTFTGLNTTHTFTVPNTDANGHQFQHWSTGPTSTTITVSSGGTYTAYYQAEYTLTITTTTGGTTNPAPGIYEYDDGAVAVVSAISDTGYLFDHWELDGNNVGATNPISVTMDSDHTLHAVFSWVGACDLAPILDTFVTVVESKTTSWDTDSIGSPFVLLDGGLYKMWYHAVSGEPPWPFRWVIAYAESSDGIVWSNKQMVQDAGPEYTYQRTEDPWVLKEDGVYRMWHKAYYPWDGYIAHMTSADGINWPPFLSDDDVIVLSPLGQTVPQGDGYHLAGPSVIHEPSGYVMWYSTNDKPEAGTGAPNKIWRATSTDGLVWSNRQLSLPYIPDTWEHQVYEPCVVKEDDGTYTMFYTARDVNDVFVIGIAKSADGITWTGRSQLLRASDLGVDVSNPMEPFHFRDADGKRYLYFRYGNTSIAKVNIGRIQLGPKLPYDVTIDAYCQTEDVPVSVSITMDGNPTGYNTPHTFTGLNTTHTFTVPNTDANGHPFQQWSTGATSTTITVSSGGTYTAYYGVKYTLTITTTGGGTTNPTPGIHTYADGEVAVVSASPYTDYLFDHWELDGNNVGATNPISVTMDSDHTLHAVFFYMGPSIPEYPGADISIVAATFGFLAALYFTLKKRNNPTQQQA